MTMRHLHPHNRWRNTGREVRDCYRSHHTTRQEQEARLVSHPNITLRITTSILDVGTGHMMTNSHGSLPRPVNEPPTSSPRGDHYIGTRGAGADRAEPDSKPAFLSPPAPMSMRTPGKNPLHDMVRLMVDPWRGSQRRPEAVRAGGDAPDSKETGQRTIATNLPGRAPTRHCQGTDAANPRIGR